MTFAALRALRASLVFLVLLTPHLASAVTLRFEALFDASDGLAGSVSGVLEAEDRDGSGTASLDEVKAFSFTADFAGTVLDVSGDQTTHLLLGSVAPAPQPIAQGFDFGAIGFLQLLSGDTRLFGTISLLVLSSEKIGILQLGPDGFAMAMARPILTTVDAVPAVISLPPTLPLMLAVLGIFGLLSAGGRRWPAIRVLLPAQLGGRRAESLL